MIDRAKQSWHTFKTSAPGRRFQDRYDRRQEATGGRWDRRVVLNILLGVAVAIAGLVLVPAPGPGWIITFLGLALLGSEFAPLARALDWSELKLRSGAARLKAVWEHSPVGVKALLVFASVLCMAVLGYGAYQVLLGGQP